MSLDDTLQHFDNVMEHGVVPEMVEYSWSDPLLGGWLDDIKRLYDATKQLHWNSLYTEDDDERDCLRYTLEDMCRRLVVQQYFVLTYGKYAITREFQINFTFLFNLKETLYQYMQVLGLMV